MTQDKTISMNGKDYDMDQVSEKAQYLVSQLKDLQTQATQLRGRLDQVDVCTRGFTQLLEAELESPEETSD